MADYKKMYLTMFHAAETVIQLLESSPLKHERDVIQSLIWLTSAQQWCEEIYIDTAKD